MPELIFFLLVVGTIIFAFMTVTSRDIFHSAVWLSMVLLNIAGVYFFLGAEFLGVIQVLVYIGGIITLFIFAIKLTAKLDDYTIPQANRQVIPSILALIVFSGFLIYAVKNAPWAFSQAQASLTLKEIGTSLMTTYLLPFEFISVILLAAMVGAIVIGRVKK